MEEALSISKEMKLQDFILLLEIIGPQRIALSDGRFMVAYLEEEVVRMDTHEIERYRRSDG